MSEPDRWAKAREVWKAKCAARTECIHGHTLADAYVYGGRRKCRTCKRERAIRYREEEKARLSAGTPRSTA